MSITEYLNPVLLLNDEQAPTSAPVIAVDDITTSYKPSLSESKITNLQQRKQEKLNLLSKEQVLADSLMEDTNSAGVPHELRTAALADNLVSKGYSREVVEPMLTKGDIRGLRDTYFQEQTTPALNQEPTDYYGKALQAGATPAAGQISYHKAEAILPENYYSPEETLKRREARKQEIEGINYHNMGILDKAANYVKGAGYFVGSGLQDTADALVEGAGKLVGEGVKAAGFEEAGEAIDRWDPIGTEEEKSNRLKDATGYNSHGVDQATERAKGYIAESLKDVEVLDPSTWGKATGDGILKALGELYDEPELALSMLYLAGPSMAVGAGTKVAGLVAGKLTKSQESLDNVMKIVINPYVQEGSKVALLSGAINNNDLDAVQATLGKDEQGNPNQVTMERALLGWAITAPGAALDRLSLGKIVDGIGKKPLVEVFKDLGESKSRALVGTLVYGAAVAAKAGVMEAPQEFIQSYIEAFNGAYGGKNEDGSEVGFKQALNNGLGEAVLGGMTGLVAGTYTSAGMQAGKAVLDAIPAKKAIKPEANIVKTVGTEANVQVDGPLVEQYANTLLELREAVQTNSINETNLADYVDKIESLYDIRTGIEGFSKEDLEKADNTYKTLASKINNLIKANPALKLSDVTTPAILGSSPAALAERVLNIALDSVAPEEVIANADSYVKFATANGVKEEDAAAIVKNYMAVEEEATVGDRGYRTYEARAKALLASSNPDQTKLRTVSNKLESFLNSTTKSYTQLQSLLEAAQAKADKFTASNHPSFGGKGVRITGEYKKLDGKSYTIDIVKGGDGKWGVSPTHTAPLNKIMDAKNSTIKNINNIISSLGAKRTDTPLNVGQLIIPATGVDKGVIRAKKSDQTHIDKALDAISRVLGESRVNKVVLDESSRAKKWQVGGDYYSANTPIVNTGSYSTTDVVMIHGTGSFRENLSNFLLKTSKDGSNKAGAELHKAIEVGATIILDRDFRNFKSKKDKSGKVVEAVGSLSPLGRSIRKYLMGTEQGYILVPGTEDTFIKSTPERLILVETLKEKAKEEKDKADTRIERLNKLLSLKALLTAQDKGLVNLTEDKLKTAKDSYEELRTIVETEYFTSEKDHAATLEVVSEEDTAYDFNDEGELEVSEDSLDVDSGDTTNKTTPRDKLEASLANRMNKEIARRVAAYGTSETANSGDPDLLNSKEVMAGVPPTNLTKGDIAFALIARAKSKSLQEDDSSIVQVLSDWKKILDKKLPERESQVEIDELLESSEIDKLLDMYGKPLTLHADILANTYSKGQSTRYITYDDKGNSKIIVTDDINAYVEELGTRDKAINIVRIVEVEPDITKFVAKKGNTLLNRVVVSALPNSLKQYMSAFHVVVKQIVQPLDKNAKSSEHFWLADSPARGLLFNTNGTLSPQVTAAMWLVLMQTLKTDKHKMTLGTKSRADVAAMLNIPESQVTTAQIKFAKENGVLNKTLANSLGKAILGELGLGKNGNTDVNKGHYELLAADLGNMAILAAEKEGWITHTARSVSDVTSFYGKEQTSDGSTDSATVRFINIKSSNLNIAKELTGNLGINYTVYVDEESKLPQSNVNRKEPFSKLSNEQISKNLTSVRNDVTGGSHAIPEEAQSTLNTLMRTKFTVDVRKAKEFLELVDASGSKIKELLGYIELVVTNPMYNALTFDAKDIQTSINRDIEKSIEELRKAVAKSDNGDSYEVQYLFYYTRNGRYMMDSNTLNPQADKIVRFLVQPSAHTLTYSLEGRGATTKFLADGKDVSYSVRLALVQAFGGDIDKSSTKDIAKVGSKLLNLNAEQLAEVKTTIVTAGKFDGYGLELEAVHLTHTLQAIDFLEQTLAGNVTSALTAEFDSVTNGFMNKLMQLPILGKSLKEHLGRVGILADSFMEGPLSKLIDLEKGEAVNRILSKEGAKTGFLDSYKNLAMTVAKGLEKSTDRVYKEFKEFLPSPVDGGISSELRSLFKAPFMTFNYSASIASIRENLSNDLVTGLLSEVVKGSDKGKEIAKAMHRQGFSISGVKFDKKTEAEAIEALIKAVRELPLTKITVAGKSIQDYYAVIFNNVYGDLVEKAFKDNFGPYIELQDYLNDAFKITFRLFEKEFNKELDNLAVTNRKVTEEEYKGIIKRLWDKFPAIKGPMTRIIDNVSYDVIPVTDSASSSNNTSTVLRDKAQTKLKGKGDRPDSIVVHAVMRFLKEAGKAGSVLPFHYIDGAELGRTVNELSEQHKKSAGFTPIHDAMMVPITLFDEATFAYNKAVVTTNETYSLMESILEMVSKWDTSNVSDKELSQGLTTGAVKGKNSNRLLDTIHEVKIALDVVAANVKDKRDIIFDNKGSFIFNNMVGTPGGYYKDGSIGPDTRYISTISEEYIITNEEEIIVEESPQKGSSALSKEVVDGIIANSNEIISKGCK